MKRNEIDDVVRDVIAGFYVEVTPAKPGSDDDAAAAVPPRFVYDPAKGKFRAYLKTCTLNALRARVRKARVGGKPVADVTDDDAEVEHVWEDVWEKELLNKAFERVRTRYKDNSTFQAFKRVLVDGQTVDEAAASLGCSKETVYKAKQRVAAAMREELEFLRGDVG